MNCVFRGIYRKIILKFVFTEEKSLLTVTHIHSERRNHTLWPTSIGFLSTSLCKVFAIHRQQGKSRYNFFFEILLMTALNIMICVHKQKGKKSSTLAVKCLKAILCFWWKAHSDAFDGVRGYGSVNNTYSPWGAYHAMWVSFMQIIHTFSLK